MNLSRSARYFTPFRMIESAELKRQQEPAQINPHLERPLPIDERERFLVALFLRRYVNLLRASPAFRADAGSGTALPGSRDA